MQPSTDSPQPRLNSGSGVWLPLVFIGAAIVAILGYYTVWSVRPKPVVPRDLAAEAREDLEQRKFRPLSGPLAALLQDSAAKPIPTQVHPLLGETAPDFTLIDINDKPWKLSDHCKDGPLVLVFYYGYYCNHCVSQLFALDQDIEKFRELGATVVAISADEPELTRQRFKTYGAFHFPVLSDPANKIATQYGTYTPSSKPGEEGDLMHGTFLLDRQRRLIWSNRGDSPFTDNKSLLIHLHRLESASRPR